MPHVFTSCLCSSKPILSVSMCPTKPMGDDTYVLEVDLLETDCHVLDPTPLANCTVRPKVLTAVEGDCDVVLKRVGGVLTVTAFKCQTEESTEDMCLGCPTLLLLNNTAALDFVHASLVTVNNFTVNETYTLLEVGRMTSQVLLGGPIYSAEYVIVEASCVNDTCVPLNDAMAARGICFAKGLTTDHAVDCRMFATLMPDAHANFTATAAPPVPPVVHVHTGSLSPKHSLRFHKLTTIHNPEMNSFLSAESAESAEVVPVVPAVVNVDAVAATDPTTAAADPADADPAAADPASADPTAADPAPADPTAADPAPATAAPIPDAADLVPADDSTSASDAFRSKELPLVFKRDITAASAHASQTDHIVLVPVCPGRVRFF
ncbi:alpha-2-HS-glycoprotein 2 isoform X2 [Notolabrus celidotus]|uniref:alpha-2-HS-glycoprotein 2 isoform X2 n=1 Tax=Notolabrus celidotus TaxID=1203425 RepID=UPI00148FBFFC|nr:alpha-2-HS-glycoprotein 2 isoform X2 [Notolabrus celidotus]